MDTGLKRTGIAHDAATALARPAWGAPGSPNTTLLPAPKSVATMRQDGCAAHPFAATCRTVRTMGSADTRPVGAIPLKVLSRDHRLGVWSTPASARRHEPSGACGNQCSGRYED